MQSHKRSKEDIEKIASHLLSSKDLRLVSCRTLQSLWAGYGHICQIEAQPASENSCTPVSLILKYITPPATPSNKPPNEGHVRKILSYQIEQYFYTHLAPTMPKEVAVASCLARIDSGSESNATAMILSDLKRYFPVAGEKRGVLNERQVYGALNWLANFHGFWWNKVQDGRFEREKLCRPPLEQLERLGDAVLEEGSVWLNGGYTYLATRGDEYRSLQDDGDPEWSSKLCVPRRGLEDSPISVAEMVAKVLSPSGGDGNDGKSPISDYETLIHGDVKSENLFTSIKGDQVAFYDFQYVGLGLGVCDIAKIFTCSVPPELIKGDGSLVNAYPGATPMTTGEDKLLRYYLKRLKEASGRDYPDIIFRRHWETALVDWLRFQASWGFWGNTEWLESRVRAILEDEEWFRWVRGETACPL